MTNKGKDQFIISPPPHYPPPLRKSFILDTYLGRKKHMQLTPQERSDVMASTTKIHGNAGDALQLVSDRAV